MVATISQYICKDLKVGFVVEDLAHDEDILNFVIIQNQVQVIYLESFGDSTTNRVFGCLKLLGFMG